MNAHPAALHPTKDTASCTDSTRRHWLAGALAVPALGLVGCSSASTSSDSPTSTANSGAWGQPWTMPGVQTVDLPAAPLPGSQTARAHRVMAYVPQGAAPAGGWPVIYVLDGNLMFPLLAQLVHNRGARGAELRGASAVVVGLGHAMPPGSEDVHDRAARTYDYTLPFDGVGPDSQGRAQGGADVFLDWMAHTLQPRLQAQLPLNMQQQTLVGHSYGGLLTLHALFTRTHMFQRYVAASPSLWWGGGLVLQQAQQFIQQCAAAPLAQPLQVYVSQGSEEIKPSASSAVPRAANPERAAAARQAQQRAQVHGMHTLQDLSNALSAIPQLRCQHDIWPGAGHGGTQMFACAQATQVGLWAATGQRPV